MVVGSIPSKSDFVRTIATVAHFIGTASRNYPSPVGVKDPRTLRQEPTRSILFAEVVKVLGTDDYGYTRALTWYFTDTLVRTVLPTGQSLPQSNFKVHPHVLIFAISFLLEAGVIQINIVKGSDITQPFDTDKPYDLRV